MKPKKIYLVFDDGYLDLKRGDDFTDAFYMAIKTDKSHTEVQKIIDDYKTNNLDDFNSVDLEEIFEKEEIELINYEIVYF